MGSNPSVFERTPEEHACATTRHLEKQRATVVWPPETSVPPRCVRVHFYAHRFKVRDGLRPDMEGVLPLTKTGELSLFSVRRLWGLETCLIIDPLELKLGFPSDPNWLPAGAVEELVKKHGCIKIIEPYVSYETLVKRNIRHIAMGCISIAHFWYLLVRKDATKDYLALQRLWNRISARIHWVHAANLCVVLALIFLVFAAVMNIDLGIARAWDAVCATVASSFCLSCGLQTLLPFIFLASPIGYSRWMELEDDHEKIIFAYCASF
ncbi:hypothetical protein C8J57DRAFT_1281245 [Mycena rebaudengoi]|nr:hypothetical protein C8J57DRAFT_1281245 [Mycena rebaudengoi]